MEKALIAGYQGQIIHDCRSDEKPVEEVRQMHVSASNDNFIIECGLLEWDSRKDCLKPVIGFHPQNQPAVFNEDQRLSYADGRKPQLI